MSALKFEIAGAGCVSESILDALHLGALSAEHASAARAHIAECAGCQARFATIEQGFEAFPRLDERRALASIRTELDQKKRRRWWMPMLVTGAAAAMVFLAVRPTPEGGLIGEPAQMRIKGKAALRIFERTAQGSAEVAPETRLAAGTHIKFGVDLPAPGAVRIMARSGADLVTLWPRAPVGPLPAGKDQVLDGAVQLDDAKGPEHLFLVHCPDASSAPACPLEGDLPVCPAPCTVSTLVVLKR